MTIKVRKSARQVAIAFASTMSDNDIQNLPKVLEDGYIAFLPYKNTDFGQEFWEEWESSVAPFGIERWEQLWKKFSKEAKSDNSVNPRAVLENCGVAVLDCDEFAVICKQEVIDRGTWEWIWVPVCVAADPS